MLHTLLLTGFLLTQAPASVQTGTVAGTLRSGDASPASRVRVVAMEAQDANAAETGTAAIVSLTQTDTSGRYRLENVPAGRYFIMAGYLDAPSYYPGVTNVTGARTVTVTAGSIATDLDFAMVRPLGLTVSGKVIRDPRQQIFGDQLVVRLTSNAGVQRTPLEAPLAADGSFEFSAVPPGSYNARVFPGDAYYSSTVIQIVDKDIFSLHLEVPFRIDVGFRIATEGVVPRVAVSFTDQHGTVRRPPISLRVGTAAVSDPSGSSIEELTTQLPEGDYRIAVTDIPSGYEVQSLSQGSTDLLRQPLRVMMGSSPGFDVKLRAPTPLPGVKVSGSVRGAQVNAIQISGPSGFSVLEAAVKGDGTFEFPRVLPGEYRARVLPNASTTVTGVTVGAKDVEDWIVSISPSRELTGRLIGESGSVPQRVRFRFDPAPNSVNAFPMQLGPRYQGDGTFTLTVPDGEYSVAVLGLPAGYRVKSMNYGSADLMKNNVLKVGPGQSGELRLVTDFASPSPWMKVRGRVVGQATFKLALVMSSAISPPGLQETPIGPDGSFEFPRVAPGTYRLTPTAPVPGVGSVAVAVADRDVDGIEIKVAVLRNVSGQVDLGPNVVRPTTRLTLRSIDPREASTTIFIRPQQDGTFVAEVPEGEYRVVPTDVPANYRLTTLTFGSLDLFTEPMKIAGADLPKLRIAYELVSSLKRVRVSGRIVGVENLSRLNSSVLLYGQGMAEGKDATLDAEGRFSFTEVESGRYTVSVQDYSAASSFIFHRPAGVIGSERRPVPGSVSKNLVVNDTDVTDVELIVEPSTLVKGRVQTENGLQIPDVFTFMLTNTAGRIYTFVRATAQGTFSPVFIDGEYKLTIENLPEGYVIKSIRQGAVDLTRESLKVGRQASAEEIVIVFASAP